MRPPSTATPSSCATGCCTTGTNSTNRRATPPARYWPGQAGSGSACSRSIARPKHWPDGRPTGSPTCPRCPPAPTASPGLPPSPATDTGSSTRSTITRGPRPSVRAPNTPTYSRPARPPSSGTCRLGGTPTGSIATTRHTASGYGALGYADDLDQRLEQADQQVDAGQTRLDHVDRRLDRLSREPAIASQPGDWLDNHYERWRADDAALGRLAEALTALAIDTAARERMHSLEHEYHPSSTTWADTGRASADSNSASHVRERRSPIAVVFCRAASTCTAWHARKRAEWGSRPMAPIPDISPLYGGPTRLTCSPWTPATPTEDANGCTTRAVLSATSGRSHGRSPPGITRR